ncbi:MAG TPA: S1C family serine protease [Pyrinomonadaceae bacterium]|nr:S1C family serine protease [Pyrinomonadaceae bacterium]
MKLPVLFAICLFLVTASRANAQETIPRLTNEDIVKMVQAGVSTDQIVATIKKSKTDFDTSPSALAVLPKRGVPNEILLAMLDSDPLGSNTHRTRKTEISASGFQQLQTSVVTVWSEFGSGTGFIIDEEGLVLTSQHVVGPSEYIGVQFDAKRKIPAKLLASDRDADVAILWINLAMIPDASVAPLATRQRDEPSVVEGERVVTIGNPLQERRTFTTGIARKVDKQSISLDINFNQGDSGGPLFNSAGEAVGMTTFLRPDISGSGVYGVLRIEQTIPLIQYARKMMRRTRVPPARFLPVDPTEPFPLDAIKTVATAKNFDMPRYSFDVGEFSVLLMTPTVRYRLATVAQRDITPFDELSNLAEYVSAHRSVLFIYAAPRSGSKTEFDEMRLFCGDREVEPIQPAQVATGGIYAYSPKSVSADCGKVKLEIYSTENSSKVQTRELDRKLIARVDEDFSPYYQKYGNPPVALLETRPQSVSKFKSEKPYKWKWWDMSKYPK